MTSPQPVVLITGAAGGVGVAMIDAFQRAGWLVVSTDVHPMDRSLHVQADLYSLVNSEGPETAQFIESVRRYTAGKLKAVVHNAALQIVKPSEDYSISEWSRVFGVNVHAPFWLSMQMLSELEANMGSILAISSIHEKLTKPGFVAYAASKSALSGMIRAMAVDLGGRVRCNAICPAAISTPMLKAGFADNPDSFKKLNEYHPIGRIGTPKELADTAVFVSSNAASFMSGACIDLSGAISARLHDPV